MPDFVTRGLTTAIGAVFAAVVATAPAVAQIASPVPLEERTIYVTVLGGQGPVTSGLTADDFRVREDNVNREVTSIRPATEPVSVVLLLDTTRDATDMILDLRKAVGDYASVLFSMSPTSRLALAEFGGMAMITLPFTSSLDEINAAIPKIVANTDGGSVMNEGFVEVSRELSKEESQRRVIVSINSEPTEEYSQIRFEDVAEAVRDSGATVYAIQVLDGLQRDAGRDSLLQALVTNSGGLRQSIGTPNSLQGLLGSIAALSAAQWAVTFSRPDGAAPAEMTQIDVRRENVRALTNMWSGK